MSEIHYPKVGFKAWALPTLCLTLPWILYCSLVVAPEMRGPYGRSLREAIWLITMLAAPLLLSGLLNWMYERSFDKEVLHSWYRHPDTFVERIICIIGGAVCVIAAPFLGFLIWGGMILWVLN